MFNGVPVNLVVEYAVYGMTITMEALKIEESAMLDKQGDPPLSIHPWPVQWSTALLYLVHRDCPYSLVEAIMGTMQEHIHILF